MYGRRRTLLTQAKALRSSFGDFRAHTHAALFLRYNFFPFMMLQISRCFRAP